MIINITVTKESLNEGGLELACTNKQSRELYDKENYNKVSQNSIQRKHRSLFMVSETFAMHDNRTYRTVSKDIP